MISDERKEFIDNLKTDRLIDFGMERQEQAKDVYDDASYAKFILLKRMLADGASILPHPDIECKGKKENTSWDYGKLALVRELLHPNDIENGFYTPEHEETIVIPEKYDMRIGRGYLKYGGEIKERLEAATIEGKIKEVTLKRKD